MTTSAFGSGSLKKSPAANFRRAAMSVVADVVLEDRADLREIEADAREVRVRQRDLRGQDRLARCRRRRTSCIPARELRRDRQIGAVADAGHRLQEAAEPRRVGVQRAEHRRSAALRFVLRQAGAQRLGEMVPEAVQAVVRHLEHAADVGRLRLVEKQVGRGRVGIRAAARAAESRARPGHRGKSRADRGMQPQPAAEDRRAVRGCFASSVNSSISTALNSVFDAQNPNPTCRMCSGLIFDS